MTRKLTTLFAATAFLAGLGTATPVPAEENTPSPAPNRPADATGMMGDHTGMMNMMGQMSADQRQQMSRTVEHCNRMMESMTTTVPNEKATESHQD
jgi:hypothetical protein